MRNGWSITLNLNHRSLIMITQDILKIMRKKFCKLADAATAIPAAAIPAAGTGVPTATMPATGRDESTNAGVSATAGNGSTDAATAISATGHESANARSSTPTTIIRSATADE